MRGKLDGEFAGTGIYSILRIVPRRNNHPGKPVWKNHIRKRTSCRTLRRKPNRTWNSNPLNKKDENTQAKR